MKKQEIIDLVLSTSKLADVSEKNYGTLFYYDVPNSEGSAYLGYLDNELQLTLVDNTYCKSANKVLVKLKAILDKKDISYKLASSIDSYQEAQKYFDLLPADSILNVQNLDLNRLNQDLYYSHPEYCNMKGSIRVIEYNERYNLVKLYNGYVDKVVEDTMDLGIFDKKTQAFHQFSTHLSLTDFIMEVLKSKYTVIKAYSDFDWKQYDTDELDMYSLSMYPFYCMLNAMKPNLYVLGDRKFKGMENAFLFDGFTRLHEKPFSSNAAKHTFKDNKWTFRNDADEVVFEVEL